MISYLTFYILFLCTCPLVAFDQLSQPWQNDIYLQEIRGNACALSHDWQLPEWVDAPVDLSYLHRASITAETIVSAIEEDTSNDSHSTADNTGMQGISMVSPLIEHAAPDAHKLLAYRRQRLIEKLEIAQYKDPGFLNRAYNIPCPETNCELFITAESKALVHSYRHLNDSTSELYRLLSDPNIAEQIRENNPGSDLVIYQCPFCQSIHSTLSEVQAHIASHASKELHCPVSDCSYKCQRINKVLTDSPLCEHIASHHKNDRKAFLVYSILSGGGYMGTKRIHRHHQALLNYYEKHR